MGVRITVAGPQAESAENLTGLCGPNGTAMNKHALRTSNRLMETLNQTRPRAGTGALG